MTSETPKAPADRETAWAAAEAYGCDMSLLESNLRKAPAERIWAHSRALAAALALRAAMESRAADLELLLDRLIHHEGASDEGERACTSGPTGALLGSHST